MRITAQDMKAAQKTLTGRSGLQPFAGTLYNILRGEDRRRKERKMNFGQALEELKKGSRVCREGWNGKGMWLKLFSRSLFITVDCEPGEPVNISSQGYSSHFDDTVCKEDGFRHIGFLEKGSFYPICDFIYLKTADNRALAWNPNNLDMLAEDWMILNN